MKRALTSLNITREFQAMGIWPMNEKALNGKMGPSNVFVPRILNFNVDRRDPNFYNFSDFDENENAHDSNRDDDEYNVDIDAEDESVPINDLGM